MVGHRPKGREDEQGEGGDHCRAGDVVDPLAEGEAADGGESQRGEKDGEGDEDGGVTFGDPGGAGTDHEGELAGDLKQDGRDRGEAVRPDVPGGEEADGVAEGAAGPDVEAAFERELAVEEVNSDGHRRVEDREGEEPDERLRVAEAGGEAYPGASDDGENLREDEVAEGELARQMVVAGGV